MCDVLVYVSKLLMTQFSNRRFVALRLEFVTRNHIIIPNRMMKGETSLHSDISVRIANKIDRQ